MCDEVVIRGLNLNEDYPELKGIITEIKQRFEVLEEINVYIVDDFDSGPNLKVEQKFVHWREWNFKEYSTLIVSRGILKKLKPDNNSNELKSLIAHEFSHIVNNDIAVLNRIFSFDLIISFVLFVLSGIFLFISPIFIILPIFVLSFGIIFGLRNINWMKKRMEMRCDTDAVFITQNPEACQKALKIMFMDFDKERVVWRNKKLSKISIMGIWYFIVGDDHPTNLERLEYMQSLKNF